MSIKLNDTNIPGYSQKLSATLPIAGEDMSGNSSFTLQAETGDKPKQLSVSTNIKYKDSADLTTIINLAEDKDKNLERKTYRITNNTAKAMNIRFVKFQGDVSVREQDDNEAWTISFKLIEFYSVPEKKESRSTAKPVNEQIPPATTDSSKQTQEQSEELQLGSFEKVLKSIDNAIA